MCSDEQKEGYVIDRFQEALNAIPCAIMTTTGTYTLDHVCYVHTLDLSKAIKLYH